MQNEPASCLIIPQAAGPNPAGGVDRAVGAGAHGAQPLAQPHGGPQVMDASRGADPRGSDAGALSGPPHMRLSWWAALSSAPDDARRGEGENAEPKPIFYGWSVLNMAEHMRIGADKLVVGLLLLAS